MTPVQVVTAVGADQHDPRVLEVAGQEDEKIVSRPVGPLEILDDEEQRHIGAEALDHAEQGARAVRRGADPARPRPPAATREADARSNTATNE